MSRRRLVVALVALAVVVAGVVGWLNYRRARDNYDAYRTRIQPGVSVAGLPVGGLTPGEARAQVREQIAEPYYRDFSLLYEAEGLELSPGNDLGLHIPVDDMVDEAVAASHQYDYWEGFKLWVQDEVILLDLDVPVQLTFDDSAAARYLASVAESYDITPSEPMVDVQALSFIPGLPGRRLDIKTSAGLINERLPNPGQREVRLPVSIVEPDQSRARIESMLSTLGPVMERPPAPPTFYTATVPLSTTVGVPGTPPVTYTGELTWTFPHFASYTGHLTSTYGFFFDRGEPGFTFDVEGAIHKVEMALQAGVTESLGFEPELVPPPPIMPALLIPPLEERLAQFPGVTSIVVKNLDTDEVIYESNADYVLSGMSIVKIGIMVEVYRHYGGDVDEQTHQELLDMLGSESCNPCANRLMAEVGGGSARAGTQKVTATMRRLGLENFYLCAPFRVVENFYLCAPFRVVELWRDAPTLVWAHTPVRIVSSLHGASPWVGGYWFVQSETPRYDRCVRATPREMAELVEMIYTCTQDRGLLRETFPEITPEACQEMIDIMASNDLRNMLGAGIPSEVKLAHKHGFSGYDVPWGDTRGEVGIVFSPGSTWLISFYIWQDTPWINWGINQPLYRDVSNMLYNYFNPDEPYWPLPPWAPAPEEDSGENEARGPTTSGPATG